MEVSKTLFCSSKSPKAQERISSKFIDNLCTCPQKGLPALAKALYRLNVSTLNLQGPCNYLKLSSAFEGCVGDWKDGLMNGLKVRRGSEEGERAG